MKAVLLAISSLLVGMTSSRTIGKRDDDTIPLTPVVHHQSNDSTDLKAGPTDLEARLSTMEGSESPVNFTLMALRGLMAVYSEIAETGVAFFAQFSAARVTAPASGPYQMDTVILNDGNGYDPTLGVFTAPVSGVYIITFQAFTDVGQPKRPVLDVIVNGIPQVRMSFDVDHAAQATGYDSDSTSFIAKLQQGNKVWIATSEKASYKFWGGYHTFFSGALLHSV